MSWIDPRPMRVGARLAPRPAAGKLRTLVFFDNGKLSPPYDRWMPLVPPLMERLQAMGPVEGAYADLLTEPVANYVQWIAGWKARGVDGVVFGLCDAGVAGPTVMFAAACEAAGIPCVVLCTDQVIDMAAVSASFAVPGLPLVLVPANRLADAESLAAAARGAAGDMAAGLVTAVDDLHAAFARRFRFVRGLARGDGDPSSYPDFSEFAHAQRMSDGLPVIEPTDARVARMVVASGRQPDEVVVNSLSPSGAPLSVQQAAACAVMAGCEARGFPLVLAALEAMAQPQYQLHLASITTHQGGHLMLFSGPLAHAAGLASGRGCLGPGHRANVSIGRAVSMALLNVGRAIPGLATLSALGSPAQITCCFADAPDGAFPPLHTELLGADDTIVWVQKCESPHNIMDHLSSTPESLLGTFASVAATLGGNNAYLPSDLLLILNPEHAELVARAGWTRKDIGKFIWEHARNPRASLTGRGSKREWPAGWAEWPAIPVVPGPDRVWVVVAGAPGPQSMVAIPWGYAQASWRRVAPSPGLGATPAQAG